VAVVARTRFVLGGGGAMGAYQAGALLGLLQEGLVPDALYGCSAGALNAAFLAAQPDLARADALATWWTDGSSNSVLSPTWRHHVRGLPAVLRHRQGVLDSRPLRRLVESNVRAHDLSELAVPLTVTTTCLDCAQERHHVSGPVVDTLVASCALPGLLPPVRLPDGHLHVDGGVVAGVPVARALEDAGPDDLVVVLDCGLAPVTCGTESCHVGDLGRGDYVPPTEGSTGPLDVVLRAFTVARAVANRATVGSALQDPRVRVVAHIADAWAAGLLAEVPRGPRDFSQSLALLEAGRVAAQLGLRSSVR
jgi:predicted acylesterase/phospholipase RssA